MSNIEEFIEEKRQRRAYHDAPKTQDIESHVQIGLDSFARSLLAGLAQQFSEDTSILAAELFRAALLDAWEATGNPHPADDEIMGHYGEEARKLFDEMG